MASLPTSNNKEVLTMAEQRIVVFDKAATTGRLPDWARAGVFIIEWLQQHRLWQEAARRLKIQREGGYAGIDAFLFLLYFFVSELGVGVKEFSERASEHHIQLAAIGGRKRLPTQASMSRILSAVEVENAQEFGSWLLREAVGLVDVIRHPSVLTRDALGEGWHVFDWDPTVTTLRHRALPVVEDTPNGRRRSEFLARPGYPGRKRGDVQFSRGTLQHAGSGLWLGVEMSPGNGAMREAFQAAVDQVVATCDYAEIALDRAILRADGAAGNVPLITACIESGIHYITRLQNYQLLQDKEVVGHLNEADWFNVPSSGSGPNRQATDLGRVVLEPAVNTVRRDGNTYEPIETRVVVSRFPCGDNERGAGVTLDGWRYELYGTDLPTTAWPEAEIVTGYYGRCGQENRFFQEDRELGLDRIFSYHLPGQALATLIGLFVWNFRICRGMELASPPVDLPPQKTDENTIPTEPPFPLVVDSTEPAQLSESTGTAIETNTEAELSNIEHQMREALAAVDWERALDNRPGWTWDAQKESLKCPFDVLLPLTRIEQVRGRPIRARFLAEVGTCDSCEFRGSCIHSYDPHYRKEMRIPIPPPDAELLSSLWKQCAQARTKEVASKRRNSRCVRAPSHRAIWRTKQLAWQPPELPKTRPSLSVAHPVLLPAELRKMSRDVTRPIEIHVNVKLPPNHTNPSPVLAFSPAERQHLRLSWEERLRWNELPDDAHVVVRFMGAHSIQRLLAMSPRPATVPAKCRN